MTRTVLPQTALAAAFDAVPCSALTYTPADASNGNRFVTNGQQICLVRNVSGTSKTITVSSVADPYGRVQDLTTHSIAAGAVHLLPRFPATGWKQADGHIWVTGSTVDIEFCVIDLSNQVSPTA